MLSSRARSRPLFALGQTLSGGEQNGGAELAVNYLVLRRAGPSGHSTSPAALGSGWASVAVGAPLQRSWPLAVPLFCGAAL